MKKLFATWLLALGAGLCAAPSGAAIVLSFTPSSTHINIGDTVSIDVSISGLGSEIVSAVDLNFLYSAALLDNPTGNFTGLFNALGAGANLQFDVLADGEVGIQAFSVLEDATLAGQQPDSFLLGSMTFLGQADGVSSLTLGLDPDFQRNFVGLNALSLQVDVGSACIAVGTGVCVTAAVPEPSSLSLMGLALVGALVPVLRRRRRNHLER